MRVFPACTADLPRRSDADFLVLFDVVSLPYDVALCARSVRRVVRCVVLNWASFRSYIMFLTLLASLRVCPLLLTFLLPVLLFIFGPTPYCRAPCWIRK